LTVFQQTGALAVDVGDLFTTVADRDGAGPLYLSYMANQRFHTFVENKDGKIGVGPAIFFLSPKSPRPKRVQISLKSKLMEGKLDEEATAALVVLFQEITKLKPHTPMILCLPVTSKFPVAVKSLSNILQKADVPAFRLISDQMTVALNYIGELSSLTPLHGQSYVVICLGASYFSVGVVSFRLIEGVLHVSIESGESMEYGLFQLLEATIQDVQKLMVTQILGTSIADDKLVTQKTFGGWFRILQALEPRFRTLMSGGDADLMSCLTDLLTLPGFSEIAPEDVKSLTYPYTSFEKLLSMIKVLEINEAISRTIKNRQGLSKVLISGGACIFALMERTWKDIMIKCKLVGTGIVRATNPAVACVNGTSLAAGIFSGKVTNIQLHDLSIVSQG